MVSVPSNTTSYFQLFYYRNYSIKRTVRLNNSWGSKGCAYLGVRLIEGVHLLEKSVQTV